jgi:hypothetical protein
MRGVLRELTDPEHVAIEVIVPPTDFQKPKCFPSTEFQLTEDGTRVTCPAGQTSNKDYTNLKRISLQLTRETGVQ